MNIAVAPNADVAQALDEAKALYAKGNPNSSALHTKALAHLPGGNTRSGIHFDPFPLMFRRGEGARLWDEDGHSYVDFLGEATAGVYGHSHPVIRAAIDDRLALGWNYGGHSSLEGRLADVIVNRFPSIERVRFVNSGTEANMFNVQLARVVTGRPAVLGFSGCYHGGFLTFAAAVNPINVPFETVVAPYNDLDATAAAIDANADRLACVIIEPMIGGGGCIPASVEFLQMLRDKCTAHGIALIFDEVMTSRLSPGGLQQKYNIIPDLTSLGKYIGGGFSAGAFGGKAEWLDRFDPRRGDAVSHSGTQNNNVFTMACGIAGLTKAYTPEAAIDLNARGDALRNRLNAICAKADVALQFTGIGSMIAPHTMRGDIKSPADGAKANAKLRELLFFDLLAHGIFMMPKRCLIALSLPLTDKDFDTFAGAVEEFISTRRSLLQ